jgi:rhodanese-related sulfurtransferase
MKCLVLAVVFGLGYLAANLAAPSTAADPKPVASPNNPLPANPAIDFQGYLKVAKEAEAHRQTRRVSEEEFIKMSGEKNTIILDARSKELYDVLHIKGAVNLSFPDIAGDSLKKTLPDKEIRILIYCNNNFQAGAVSGVVVPVPGPGPQGQPGAAVAARAFPSKLPTASLNISTYIALYNYGYKNVYELAPLIDPAKSKLTFESTPKPTGRQ